MSDQGGTSDLQELIAQVRRLSEAMEAVQQKIAPKPDLTLTLPACESGAFAWSLERAALMPVPKVARMPLSLLVGIDLALSQLLENTQRFAKGLPANNVLLWGARGTGKSSSVKAVRCNAAAISRRFCASAGCLR